MKRALMVACLAAALPLLATSDETKDRGEKKEEGFKPIFNGKNLDGWVKVNSAPDTFRVKAGEIVTTGVPTGFLRTDKMYENFILELEWKHLPPGPKAVGNSGLFVWADALPAVGTPFTRAVEVQVLVNLEWKDKKGQSTATSHGDLFSIWGAKCVPDRPHPLGWERCIPLENRAKGAGEWNHYRVMAKDGVIKLAVNGKVVSGVSKVRPRKGYLALEAEGSECRFRNLKIKELPSTNPKAEEVCQKEEGFVTLFTGLDLAGWEVDKDQKGHWKAAGGANVLSCDGKAETGGIATSKEYGDFEMVCDVRLAKKGGTVTLLPHASKALSVDLSKGEVEKWNRFTITCKGNKVTARLSGKVLSEKDAKETPSKGPIRLEVNGPTAFCNLFVRELK